MQTSSYNISHGNIMCSIGNGVNNIVITAVGDRLLYRHCCDHFIRYINVESLCCTPAWNYYIVLKINFQIKRKKRESSP